MVKMMNEKMVAVLVRENICIHLCKKSKLKWFLQYLIHFR